MSSDDPKSTGETAENALGVEQRIGLVLFALSVGAIALLLVLIPRVADGIQEVDEQRIFVVAWPACLVLGIVTPWLVSLAQRRWIRGRAATLFWPLQAFAHSVFWCLALKSLKTINAGAAPGKYGQLQHAFKTIAVANVGTTLTVFFALFGFDLARRKAEKPSRFALEMLAQICILLTVPALASIQLLYIPEGYNAWSIAGLLALSILVYFALLSSFESPGTSAIPRLLSIGNLVVLVALVLFLWFPEIVIVRWPAGASGSSAGDIWIDHYNYYLGPVAAVLGGRSPLVDANAQYGVGVTYFLALVLKLHLVDASARGMARLVCFLQILRYFVLYVTLRRLTKSLWIGVLFVCIALGIEAYGTKFVYIRLPNEGPLRFLVEFLLVAAIAFQSSRARGLRSQIPSLVLVGIGTLWSPDVAVTTLGTYLGTRALVAWRLPTSFGARVRAFAFDFGCTLCAVALAVALLSLQIRLATHAWPIWDRSIEWLRFYATWNVWTVPIETWAPWLPVALIYLGSVVGAFYEGNATFETQAILAMSLVGISEMNYYIGRSFTENLAAVSIAAVFLACYWATRLARATAGLLRFAIVTGGAAAALIALLMALPGFAAKLPFSLLVRAGTAQPTPPWEHTAESIDASMLMLKYAPNHRRVAIFVAPDVEVEALLMAGKTQLWPLAYPEEDILLPRAKQAAIDFKPALKTGEIVIVGPGLDPLQKQIWDDLALRTKMVEVEATPSGVRAMRVTR